MSQKQVQGRRKEGKGMQSSQYCLSFKDERDIQGQLPKILLPMIGVLMAGWVEDIRRARVLGLVLIAGTAIEQAPSVRMMVMIFGMVSRRNGWSVRINNVRYGCQ